LTFKEYKQADRLQKIARTIDPIESKEKERSPIERKSLLVYKMESETKIAESDESRKKRP
jgi:hypothetical protein